MPKEEWGTKRLCPHCAIRFYDLNNNPMTCPACGNEFPLETIADGRSKPQVSEKTSSKKSSDNLVDDDDGLDTDNGDLDDDLLDEDDDSGDVSLDDIADVSKEDEE